MELEALILSEVSQKKKDKYHLTSHVWNLIYGTNEPFHRKESHGLGEQTCGCRGGGRGGGSGMDGEFGVSRCKLLHLEWIVSEILLYSTGNNIWSPVMELMEDNVTKECVCVCVCVCVTLLTVEIDRTL